MFKTFLRIQLLLGFSLLPFVSTWAQIDLSENYQLKKGFLYFSERSKDFGVIQEEDGTQTEVFIAYNIAKDPLIITDISVACGCTEVIQSKDTVAPGDSVKFWVNY
ncbi:MAG: DUF1573 domain-containing protein, partial [Bacteroidota bacterium]|nr:DUF1573 domain-containing protein [Bacteroidota bacterium]MDX5429572.1 DUF1573 domain-containing protein [Bacteroidota bacterium]MDX5468359.1 DUF1573 domain-containing protein [Bacteroidota bacterium]